jgi:two-component system OmpR family response regulator
MRRAAPRALIVDDDLATCELLELALGDDGWHVQARTCPQAALALLKEWAVDVILLDLIMSEMNAETFLDACRQQGFGETPILLLSAAPGLDEHAARLGVSGSLAKPFEIDALYARLRQLVAQGQAVSAARGAANGY